MATANYRPVQLPIVASPCRNCPSNKGARGCKTRKTCSKLSASRNDLLSEVAVNAGVTDFDLGYNFLIS